MKLVTESSMHMAGFERRDQMIRQKIKSRKLYHLSTPKSNVTAEYDDLSLFAKYGKTNCSYM